MEDWFDCMKKHSNCTLQLSNEEEDGEEIIEMEDGGKSKKREDDEGARSVCFKEKKKGPQVVEKLQKMLQNWQ